METHAEVDRQIITDAHLSKTGLTFLEHLVDDYGSRFGGSDEERAAADFLQGEMERLGATKAWKEGFPCHGWRRKNTELFVTAPESRSLDCIALPNCPPGEVEGPLVYLGDGHPQMYEEQWEAMKGAIVMVSTATPKFYHRTMHRGEKLGRALEAGAVGFIWMRGEPGGLPETGSARFGELCEVPAISVSYEVGQQILRIGRGSDLRVRILSDNEGFMTESFNVVGELSGESTEVLPIVVGAHYDGHDISESAADNGAGVAVMLETLRLLAPFKDRFERPLRFVAFAQEEMGLLGSEAYASGHAANTAFMLNLDGAGRGRSATFLLQGWPEAMETFREFLREMFEEDVAVGDQLGLYSDMYPFAVRGVPAATFSSSDPVSGGAPRGYGHTYWDSLDKIKASHLQLDASRMARLLYRLLTVPEPFPWLHKPVAEMKDKLQALGYEEVLRYEKRTLPSGPPSR